MIDDLISIITPVYNAERFINETIKSVKSQTYKNWEMILIDDCSSDDSKIIIQMHVKEDDRIKYFVLPENSGAAVSRNTGISQARGRFIAFIDSDDRWHPEKLERQLAFMRREQLSFTFTAYEMITEQGMKTNKIVNVPQAVNYNQLLKNTIIGCSTVVIDRSITGNFSMPLVRKGQDTATWLSMLRTGIIANGLNEVLTQYRITDGSISSGKISALKRTWYTYRKIEKLNFIKCIYVFICYIFNAFKKRM